MHKSDRRQSTLGPITKALLVLCASSFFGFQAWLGVTMNETSSQLSGIAVSIGMHTQQLEKLTNIADNRYRKSDAESDFEWRDKRDEEQTERIKRLEKLHHEK